MNNKNTLRVLEFTIFTFIIFTPVLWLFFPYTVDWFVFKLLLAWQVTFFIAVELFRTRIVLLKILEKL